MVCGQNKKLLSNKMYKINNLLAPLLWRGVGGEVFFEPGCSNTIYRPLRRTLVLCNFTEQ